ncbi:hypothetical protein P3S67_008229 [Capsicum chacoense]
MKGSTSKIIMASILIMVVTLAIILGLVLVLLVEFFCSFLLRRAQRSKTPVNFETTSTTQLSPQNQRSKCATNFAIELPSADRQQEQSIAPITTNLSSFYAKGVLHAPRNYLFPTISTKDHHYYNFDDLEIVHANVIPYPKLVQCSTSSTSASATMDNQQFVYISNPMYDSDTIALDTPFETPNSSPSCLEIMCCSSEEEENCRISSISSTPSSVLLTPMKQLPAEACSISLGDVRSSLGTSRSGSINSNNSFSSSGTPCTSPSW